jgi:CRP-like cAMP-binding protein
MFISSISHKKWDPGKGHSPLTDFVKQIYPASGELLKFIDDRSFTCSVGKGKYIIKAGELSRHLYLIRKGVIRAYIKDGNKEITTWITAENEIITSIRGFHLQQPSLENIQAIEDCELVGASYDDLQLIYEMFPEMNIVGRKLLEQYYIDAEERAYIARLSKASIKYDYFLDTKGHLANRIHLKYIASFLGMTIETLSRIRSKLGKGNR